jgi:hypothetical protein
MPNSRKLFTVTVYQVLAVIRAYQIMNMNKPNQVFSVNDRVLNQTFKMFGEYGLWD